MNRGVCFPTPWKQQVNDGPDGIPYSVPSTYFYQKDIKLVSSLIFPGCCHVAIPFFWLAICVRWWVNMSEINKATVLRVIHGEPWPFFGRSLCWLVVKKATRNWGLGKEIDAMLVLKQWTELVNWLLGRFFRTSMKGFCLIIHLGKV